MATKDPVVEEIRKIRDAHAKKFDYDLERICKDLKEEEKVCGHEIVTFAVAPDPQDADKRK